MSLIKNLSFRLRSRGYNPEPVRPVPAEGVPIALKVDGLLKRRDVVDARLAEIDAQINEHHREIGRLRMCRLVAEQDRNRITREIKDIRPW